MHWHSMSTPGGEGGSGIGGADPHLTWPSWPVIGPSTGHLTSTRPPEPRGRSVNDKLSLDFKRRVEGWRLFDRLAHCLSLKYTRSGLGCAPFSCRSSSREMMSGFVGIFVSLKVVPSKVAEPLKVPPAKSATR